MSAPENKNEWIFFDAENLTYEGKPEHYKVVFWRLSPGADARWFKVLDPTREGVSSAFNGWRDVATISVYFNQCNFY